MKIHLAVDLPVSIVKPAFFLGMEKFERCILRTQNLIEEEGFSVFHTHHWLLGLSSSLFEKKAFGRRQVDRQTTFHSLMFEISFHYATKCSLASE